MCRAVSEDRDRGRAARTFKLSSGVEPVAISEMKPHRASEENYHLHEHTCDLSIGHIHEEEAGKPSSDEYRRERGTLLGAIFLTSIVTLVEGIGGISSNSLALISDAGHMLIDLLTLVISYLALVFSIRPPSGRRSFGFYRLEILAALLNGIVFFGVTAWIFYESYRRFLSPQPIATGGMMTVALIGLMANLLNVFLLRRRAQVSVNVRSAFLHVMGDTLSSAGVVAGALLISLTDWWVIDPLLGVLLSLLILYWAIRLIIDSVDILLEAAPREIDPAQVASAVKIFEEVKDVHDIHVWTLTSGMYALSAHIAVREMPLAETSQLLRRINVLLCQKFGIGHAAIQFELEPKKQ